MPPKPKPELLMWNFRDGAEYVTSEIGLFDQELAIPRRIQGVTISFQLFFIYTFLHITFCLVRSGSNRPTVLSLL